MNRDGRDSDDADWLLAQLVSRQPPAPQEPPVVTPPVVTPPSAVTPPPAAPSAPPPRREEVLDWFSLAEPETSPDAATRALPIIGVPPVGGPAVPHPAGTPPTSSFASPAVPPVAPAAPTGLPSWNPPFMVGRPDSTVPHVSHPSTSPLKTVEPPVGDVPPVAAPSRPDVPVPPVAPAAATAPAPPVVDQAPVAPEPPVTPATPPGPVTPTSSFALTWGAGELDSEDAIRAAFRSLGGAGSTPPAADPAVASDPADSAAGQGSPSATPADVPHDSAPATDVEPSPFADFRPPVARQSFTPVTPPTPTPPRHPIAPTTAPAGWDERPAQPAPQKDFDGELWSALTEADAPAPTEQQVASVPPAAAAVPTAAAPLPPAAAPVPPAAAAAPAPPAAVPVPPVATPPTEAPNHSNQANGFPFIEVRGDAGSSASTFGAPAAESAMHSRVPYPAFASTGGDDDRSRRPDSQPEPVDDLLAALGAGTARPSRDERPSGEPAAGQGGGPGGTPPERGGTPPSEPPEDPLDALRLAFTDDADGLDRHDDLDHDEPDAGAEPDEKDSPIAREIAETGYFWNLTPDPSASDPKADPAVPPAAAGVPSPFGRPSPFAAEEDVPAFAEFEPEPAFEVQAEPEPEPEPESEPTWQFGGDALSAMFPTAPAEPVAPTAALPTAGSVSSSDTDDPLASLFGAANAAPAAPAAPSPGTATRAPSALPQTAGSGGPGRGAPSGSSGASGGSGGNRTVRTLFWIAGGLVVAVVIAGLFFLGTQLPFGGGGGEAQSPSAEPGATETPVPEPTAQQPVGVHAWNTLFGGECIDPFVSVWEEEFTVVDCAAPHAAQLVYRGELAADAAAPFPGEAEVGAQAVAACTADGVIDVGLVAGIPDLQVQGAYPVTEEQWTSGERTFYCFANRAGGEQLTASIAGPGPAA